MSVQPSERGLLEQALAAAEDAAGAAARADGLLQRELKRASGAARDGQVRELRRAVAAAREQWVAVGVRLATLESAYDVDETAYLAGGGYLAEVLTEAGRAGVRMSTDPDDGGRLLSYPSVVRVVAGDAAVEVDRRRDRRIRPSVLVARLAKAQLRPPRFRADAFLEALASGYDLVLAREGRDPSAVIRLDAVWAVLTLLPGSRSDYGRPEFSRDLYLLDQDGARTVKDGRVLRLAASSGTRGAGVLTTVARSGQQQIYWGMALDVPAAVDGSSS